MTALYLLKIVLYTVPVTFHVLCVHTRWCYKSDTVIDSVMTSHFSKSSTWL